MVERDGAGIGLQRGETRAGDAGLAHDRFSVADEGRANPATLEWLSHPKFVEPLTIDITEPRRHAINLGDVGFAVRLERQADAVWQERAVVRLEDFPPIATRSSAGTAGLILNMAFRPNPPSKPNANGPIRPCPQ